MSVVEYDFLNTKALFPLSKKVLYLLKKIAEEESLCYEIRQLGRERVRTNEVKVKVFELPCGLLLAIYLPGLRQRFSLPCDPLSIAWLKRKVPDVLRENNIRYVYGPIHDVE